jgi:putative photosynthetic complex assembly protein
MQTMTTATPFPRAPLIAAATLVAIALITAAAVRVTGVGAVRVADAPAVAERALRFEDRPDGGITIVDAASDREIGAAAPGTNGFLRSTLRGLARERKRQSIGAEQPFVLIGRADGRLTLIDPATQRRVDLEAFGPTNADVFARLLRPAGGHA